MKTMTAGALALGLILFNSACTGESLSPPGPPCVPEPINLKVAPTIDTVAVGRGTIIKILDGQAPLSRACTLVITSNDSLVATAQFGGGEFGFQGITAFVTGMTPGTTTVTVEADDSTASVAIRVVPVDAGFTALSPRCALTAAGVAYCWGVGSPVPVRVRGNVLFSAIASSAMDACGLTSGGTAYCWGWRSSVGTPVAIGGLTFSTVSAGSLDSCGLTPAGAAYCWGYSRISGETLCDESNCADPLPHPPTPKAVPGGFTFASIAVGNNHACGLTAAGAAYCWGSNTKAQLGGTGPAATTPTAVPGSLVFAALTAGSGSTCGLTADSLAYCWGWADLGQLGDSTLGTAMCGSWGCGPLPVAVAGGLKFTVLRAGDAHMCGLVATGAAFCWGSNYHEELGGYGNALSSFPVPVSGGNTFESIALAGDHACGFDDAVVYCWGGSDRGSGSPEGSSATPLRVSGQP